MSTNNIHQAASATPEQATDLFLLEDLEEEDRTRKLAESNLDALRAVADWIRSFVARPNKDLGRPGPVCPFVPGALEGRTLWLASEPVADRSVLDVVQLVNGYKTLFLRTPPIDGDRADYKAIVVVFPDLPADRAKDFFDELLQDLQVRSYVADGLVLGAFYERNEGSAIYNPEFRPFRPPVPFLLVRHAVVSDWKFFLDDEEGLNRWAQRFGQSAVRALAEELRRLPWRDVRLIQ
jgi:hypothetical protein